MSGMEIELKAGLSATEARRLQRDLVQAHGAGKGPARLRSLYFDTADGRLAKAGIALRIRREAGRTVQTVKAARRLVGGFQQVREIDAAVRGLAPCLQAIAERTIREKLLRLTVDAALQPIFETRVQRTRWQVSGEGGLVEVALDRGMILAGNRSQPVLEVEFELLGGSPGAVFAVADGLLGERVAWLSIPSKAARGMALARGTAVVPAVVASKPKPPLPQQASASAFAAGLQQLAPAVAANLHILLTSDMAEGPHQLRVSLRRLRTLLKLHRRALKPGLARDLGHRARHLGQIVSPLRDADVLVPALLTEAPADLRAALHEGLHSFQDRQRKETQSRLCTERATGFSLELLELAALGGWRRQGDDVPIEARATPLLKAMWAEICPRGDALARLPEEERHELRKLLKKLRYTLEIVPKEETPQFARGLKRLQEDLGILNDISVLTHWKPPLESVEAQALFRQAQARILTDGRHRADLAMGRACRHWLALRESALPWRAWQM